MKAKVYSTPTCPYCTMLKDFLKEHNIEFEDIDVSADRDKAEEMVQKSGQMGVPVLVVGEGKDEKVIIGFDKDAVKEALDIKE